MKKEKESLEAHIASHHPHAVRERLQQGTRSSYLRDFIYGSIEVHAGLGRSLSVCDR